MTLEYLTANKIKTVVQGIIHSPLIPRIPTCSGVSASGFRRILWTHQGRSHVSEPQGPAEQLNGQSLYALWPIGTLCEQVSNKVAWCTSREKSFDFLQDQWWACLTCPNDAPAPPSALPVLSEFHWQNPNQPSCSKWPYNHSWQFLHLPSDSLHISDHNANRDTSDEYLLSCFPVNLALSSLSPVCPLSVLT